MYTLNDYIDLLPHSHPIKMIESIQSMNVSECISMGVISKDNPFLYEDQSLSEMAYIELMAQTSAVYLVYHKYLKKINDYNEVKRKKESLENLGYLVTMNSLNFNSCLKLGDQFLVKSKFENKIDNFDIFKCEIYILEELISSGEITVYSN